MSPCYLAIAHAHWQDWVTTFVGSSRWPLKVRLHLSISTTLMRLRRPKQYCLQLYIALWCKNQIEHSIWDESLLFSNCARSLEYSSSSTLAGLSYHICGKLEVAFKGSLSYGPWGRQMPKRVGSWIKHWKRKPILHCRTHFSVNCLISVSTFCHTKQICSIKEMNIFWGLSCTQWISSLIL